MAHRSRIAGLCVDCRTDDLTEALAFWSAALGQPGEVVEDGRYAELAGGKEYPQVILQKVDHDPRVHLDIETDDQEAEKARLEALGAKAIGRAGTWIVMEAPTGHRFCLVTPQTDDFAEKAATREAAS